MTVIYACGVEDTNTYIPKRELECVCEKWENKDRMVTMNRLRKLSCVFMFVTLTAVVFLHHGIARTKENSSGDNFVLINQSSNWTSKFVLGRKENVTANANSRWIVISIAVSSKMSAGYVFCVPIVVAAWKRIGWHTVILVAGDIDHWNASPLFKLVRQTTVDIDETARFVTIPVKRNPVSFAQISRCFSSLLLPWIEPNHMVMTSDVDILPLSGKFYDIVTGSKIFVLNADCCSTFVWKNQSITMQPMTSIGMSLKNWNLVMNLKPLQKNETFVDYVNSWLLAHYGKAIPEEDVQKGENEMWYLDQRVVSIRLHEAHVEINKIRRNSRSDRVDRGSPGSWHNFRQHVDAHMFLNSFRDKEWVKTHLLLKDIFSEDVVNKLTRYKHSFVDMNIK